MQALMLMICAVAGMIIIPAATAAEPRERGHVVVLFSDDFSNRISDLYDEKTGRYSIPHDLKRILDAADALASQDPTYEKAKRGEVKPVKVPKVGIVDTGILKAHPALRNQIVETVDFSGEGIGDRNGHGTFMAILAVQTSIIPSLMVDIKAVPSSGKGEYNSLLSALDWVTGKGFDLIQMSLGIYLPCISVKIDQSASRARASCENQQICRKVSSLEKEGTVTMAAVGNETGRIACPACCAASISVGSMNSGSGADVTIDVNRK